MRVLLCYAEVVEAAQRAGQDVPDGLQPDTLRGTGPWQLHNLLDELRALLETSFQYGDSVRSLALL